MSLVAMLAGTHSTTSYPRALRGPWDSKWWLSRAVPAARSLPAQGPSNIHQTLGLHQTATLCPAQFKEQVGGIQKKEEKSPAHVMPDRSEKGRCIVTSESRELPLNAGLRARRCDGLLELEWASAGGALWLAPGPDRLHRHQALGEGRHPEALPRRLLCSPPPAASPSNTHPHRAAGLWPSQGVQACLFSHRLSKMWGKHTHGKHHSDRAQKRPSGLPLGSQYQRPEFAQVERFILFTVNTLVR